MVGFEPDGYNPEEEGPWEGEPPVTFVIDEEGQVSVRDDDGTVRPPKLGREKGALQRLKAQKLV